MPGTRWGALAKLCAKAIRRHDTGGVEWKWFSDPCPCGSQTPPAVLAIRMEARKPDYARLPRPLELEAGSFAGQKMFTGPSEQPTHDSTPVGRNCIAALGVALIKKSRVTGF